MRRVVSSTYSPPIQHLPQTISHASSSRGDAARFRLTSSQEGEQFAILQLMKHCLFQYDENEFHSQQERPDYDPRERLTFRLGNQIIGHIRCVPQQIWHGGSLVSYLRASEFVLAPEYVDMTNVDAFFQCLDESFDRYGGTFMMHRTSAAMAQRLTRFGWVALSNNFRSTAATEPFLVSVRGGSPSQQWEPSPRKETGLWIRLMRQVEADALVSLYEKSFRSNQVGTPRSTAMWDWLLRRKAFDALYVAIRGGNKLALDDAIDRIAGYAIVKDQQILEVITQPHEDEVKVPLINRICSDLYEANHREFRLEAPASDSVHAILQQVPSTKLTPPGEEILVRMPNPVQHLAEFCTVLHQRAVARNLELPLDLGLLIDGEKYCIHLGKRKGTLSDGRLGRSYLEISGGQLVRLLLGDLLLPSLVESGQLHASTQVALNTATKLFDYDPPWFPAVDVMPM
ncbi:hypothetical protein [Blastopirellula marina]|uniref:Uncharacterized protein n=1 Tax=Blastopirellula marina TaxID=124 RepID=A0A2S8FH77_9BACT|nr:hypothetical protein [Blastopirellula marina]PQO31541.1 hypothetical protein C5Y98_19145 [Blastopirellula marina]PTL42847.1 hypothetical protein C5Y97_19155 [Blastopirellula marina]